MQKIKKGDKVRVITGKDKGKEGSVLSVLKEEGRVMVEGVGIVKKHVKPGTLSKEGGIVSVEKPIDVSNVMVICDKCSRPVRVRISVVKEKKHRVCVRCGEFLAKK